MLAVRIKPGCIWSLSAFSRDHNNDPKRLCLECLLFNTNTIITNRKVIRVNPNGKGVDCRDTFVRKLFLHGFPMNFQKINKNCSNDPESAGTFNAFNPLIQAKSKSPSLLGLMVDDSDNVLKSPKSWGGKHLWIR